MLNKLSEDEVRNLLQKREQERRFQSMKNRKLSARVVVSLMLSAILFCMPIGAFFANRTNTIEVHAEDTAEQKTESASDAENTVTPGNGREENSGTDTGDAYAIMTDSRKWN